MTMHMGHVALRVPDLDAAAGHAKRVLGLRETDRTATQVLLSSNEKHHELQLVLGDDPRLDHVGLEVDGPAELEAVRERATAAGAVVLDDLAAEHGIGRAIRVVGPAGIAYEIYVGMHRAPLSIAAHLAPGIRKFGHLTFLSVEHEAIVAFWGDVLGFRLSDVADGLTWMRCDADHHGLAVGDHADSTVLHHHAWEVQDWGALGQYCDDLALNGLRLLWGPVRHGPGFNLATYVSDSIGGVIEVYTDLMQIPDDRAYERIDWSSEPRALNLWGPAAGEDLLSAGIPIVDATTTIDPALANDANGTS